MLPQQDQMLPENGYLYQRVSGLDPVPVRSGAEGWAVAETDTHDQHPLFLLLQTTR